MQWNGRSASYLCLSFFPHLLIHIFFSTIYYLALCEGINLTSSLWCLSSISYYILYQIRSQWNNLREPRDREFPIRLELRLPFISRCPKA